MLFISKFKRSRVTKNFFEKLFMVLEKSCKRKYYACATLSVGHRGIIFVNLPTQVLQRIIKAVASVASVDQNLPTEQTIFLNQLSAVNDANFQQTLQREAF